MEKWLPVVGFEGRYEVSDDGRVRNLRRGRLVKHRISRGYVVYGLMKEDGRRYSTGVHRLVLTAFVGPCPDGFEGAHEDGNRMNNRLSNLRWSTRMDNIADRSRHGTTARGDRHGMRIHKGLVRGERNGRAIICESAVPVIRSLFPAITAVEIARRYGMTESGVRNIIKRRSWRHVA